MPRILTKDKHERLEDYASSYPTNWRGIEACWHPLWTEYLTTLWAETASAESHLSIAPQFPLVQWNVPLAESFSLELILEAGPSQVKDTGRWDAHCLRIEGPSSFPSVSNRIRLDSITKAAIDSMSEEDSSMEGSSPTSPETDTVIAGPGEAPDTPPRGAPSSTKTRRAKRQRDSYFYIDFAVIEVAGYNNQHQPTRTHNRISRARDVYSPLALELNALPSRSTDGDDFTRALSMKFRDAYTDLHRKAPVVFYCHRSQESMIGVAAVGPWWSFTLIKRTDFAVVWSKAYKCGNESHDNLLRKLFTATREFPTDPVSYDGGSLLRLLTDQKRTTYNSEDCVSLNLPPII